MSNMTETKLNRLTINKETIQDLDVPTGGDIKGGATVNQNQTERFRCDLVDQTVGGFGCDQTKLAIRCSNS